MAIGYGVVGGALGGGAVGYLLDRAFGTYPWLLLAGAVIGLCVWFYALSVALKRRG
jgi:F0F1-type ATP synthase assembly protein I